MMGAGKRPDGDYFRSNGAGSNIRHYQVIHELKFSIFFQLFRNIKKHSRPLRVGQEPD